MVRNHAVGRGRKEWKAEMCLKSHTCHYYGRHCAGQKAAVELFVVEVEAMYFKG